MPCVLGPLTLVYAQWCAWLNQASDILRDDLVVEALIASCVLHKFVACQWLTIRLGATESSCAKMDYLPANIVTIRSDLNGAL